MKITKELKKRLIEKSQENDTQHRWQASGERKIIAKFYLPGTNRAWFISTYQNYQDMCYGYITGDQNNNRCRYFHLWELEDLTNEAGQEVVEEELYTTFTLEEVEQERGHI
jgi:hypothetical protein